MRIGICDQNFECWQRSGYAIGNKIEEGSETGNSLGLYNCQFNINLVYKEKGINKSNHNIQNPVQLQKGLIVCCKLDMKSGKFYMKNRVRENEPRFETNEIEKINSSKYHPMCEIIPIDQLYYPAITFYGSDQLIYSVYLKIIPPFWSKENHILFEQKKKEIIFTLFMISSKRKQSNLSKMIPKPVLFIIFNYLIQE